MGNNIAIEFEHVSKQYRLGLVSTKTLSHDIRRFWITNVLGKEDPYLKIGETNDRASKGNSEYVWALRDIDFKVEQGDVVGIIGKNGAGKSTLLKLLSRVTGPTTGTIRAHGRIGSLLEVGTGFHGEMTGRENIFMNGAILGMTRNEIQSKLDEIIDFSGCERYIDTPVKRYSSGMTVRLGFAVAAFLEPEILVVDEVLAVGDAEFQKKAIGKMKDVSQGQGRTVLFVSHNMESIRNLCNTGVLLENGIMKYRGDIASTVSKYLSGMQEKMQRAAVFAEDKNNYFNFLSAEVLVNGKATEEPAEVFDKISFKVTYKLDKRDAYKCVYFVLRRDDVQLAFILDTTNRLDIYENREPGIYEMEFELPTPLLKPGLYSVDLHYTAPRQPVVQEKLGCIQFQVVLTSKDEYHAGYALNRPGLIAVDPVLNITKLG